MNIPSYFIHRASCRNFDSTRRISEQTLNAIIEAAAHAPNTGNMQLYSVVATTESTGKAALAALHFNQPASTGADVLLTVCADTRRFARWCRARKTVSGMDNFGGRLSAFIDASIFAQQIVSIAEMEGIGTCYLGTAIYNADKISKLLNLPEGVIPVVGIAMGYPAAAGAASDRLPLSAILHREHYADADIDTAYAEKEALPESAGFIAENRLETLAQVYAQVRYPEETNIALGKEMLALMQK